MYGSPPKAKLVLNQIWSRDCGGWLFYLKVLKCQEIVFYANIRTHYSFGFSNIIIIQSGEDLETLKTPGSTPVTV